MKNSLNKFTPIAASIAALSLTLAPLTYAQTADQTTNTKSLNSADSANNNSSSTGSSASQPGTLDKTNSKDGTSTADKNPGMAPTDSANASATKDNTTGNETTEPKMAKKSSGASEKGMSDTSFIETAAQGGMTEVELGKLAEQNASSSDVKQFGTRMVTDHSKADADLKSIADKKGVTVPSTLDAKHQAMVTKFQHLSGPAFDKAYVHMMVKDHEKDASVFRAESQEGTDPDVKAFAGDTLKVIEMHLSDIKSIQTSMK
jgi:putative membrane protein